MKNILYVREHETNLDHIGIILQIAKQIRAKSHNVRISVSSSASTSPFIKKELVENGLEFIEIPVARIKMIDEQVRSHTELMQQLSCFRTQEDFRIAFKSWLILFEKETPDLVICDFAPAALLTANQLGIPTVLFDLGFFVPDTCQILSSLVDFPISSLQAVHKSPTAESERNSEEYLLKLVNTILSKFNFSSLDKFSDFYKADKTFWLNHNETIARTGNVKSSRVFANENSGITDHWKLDRLDSPKIFAYLKQDDPASSIIIQALRYHKNLTTIVYIPNCHKKIKEAYDSDNLIIADQPINIPQILENADLIINNAGAGLIAQSLLAGKPLLLAPTSFEQRLNADRAVKFGAAIWLQGDITHTSVMIGLYTLLGNGYYTVSARAFALKYRSMDVESIAGTIIETIFANRRNDLASLQENQNAGLHVNVSPGSPLKRNREYAPNVCAILLSYKRPQNIERIIKNLIATPDIKHVILSNNNPDIDLHKWLNLEQYPIEFIQQSRHAICIKRFEIALDLPYDYFICPDDDLFLNPQQLQMLLYLAQKDKSRVHGVFGQIKSFNDNGFGLFSGVHGVSCEVEMLNRVYCFSREHLLKMVEFIKQLNFKSMSDTLHIDDLLISFSGRNRPMCHDLGFFEECPSSLEAGIAVCTEDGFEEIRLDAYRHLIEITGRN